MADLPVGSARISRPKLREDLRLKLRPRLATILIIVNLAVVLLPLGSIAFLRIYENQLIQETERELIAQAAFIAAVYEAAIEADPRAGAFFGRPVRPLPAAAQAFAAPLAPLPGNARYRPVEPRLDLARDDVLPPRPDGSYAGPANPVSSAIGVRLEPVMARAQETTLAGMLLLDPSGIAVAGRSGLGLSFAAVPEVAAALAGHYASVLRFRELESAPPELASISRGTGVRVFVALPVERAGRILGVVYLSRTPKSALKHLYEEREKVALAALLVLALAASLALLTARTISWPVAGLLRRTRQIMAGDEAALAPDTHRGTREIAELSEGITAMAAALNDRTEYIRTFAAHVSHEFKTPLAAIQGAVELLADHSDTITPEERARFLANIHEDSARLQDLLRRLLELARAENAAPGTERIALGPALGAAAAAQDRDGLKVSLSVPEGLEARIAEDALAIIVDNLAENARQHGAKTLAVKAARRTDEVELLFSDNGTGISPANRARIFEHFFTTRREAGGTGLGLGIVRALAEAHGGRVELADTPGRGASFRVVLRG